MEVSAYNKRKARGSFPTEKVSTLATNRPDLKIDMAYVLTGVTSEAHSRLGDLQRGIEMAAASGAATFQEIKDGGQVMAQQMAAARLMAQPMPTAPPGLTPDELALLADYRALDARAKAGVRALMAGITPGK